MTVVSHQNDCFMTKVTVKFMNEMADVPANGFEIADEVDGHRPEFVVSGAHRDPSKWTVELKS